MSVTGRSVGFVTAAATAARTQAKRVRASTAGTGSPRPRAAAGPP